MKIKIPLEQNQTDARLKIITDGVIQTLKARMGTGGNHVPLILELEEGKDDEALRILLNQSVQEP